QAGAGLGVEPDLAALLAGEALAALLEGGPERHQRPPADDELSDLERAGVRVAIQDPAADLEAVLSRRTNNRVGRAVVPPAGEQLTRRRGERKGPGFREIARLEMDGHATAVRDPAEAAIARGEEIGDLAMNEIGRVGLDANRRFGEGRRRQPREGGQDHDGG